MAPSLEEDVKTEFTSVSPDRELVAYDDAVDPPLGGTQNDRRDMYRVGKTQELNVRISPGGSGGTRGVR